MLQQKGQYYHFICLKSCSQIVMFVSCQLNKPLLILKGPQCQQLFWLFQIFQKSLWLRQMLPKQGLMQSLCRSLTLLLTLTGLWDQSGNSCLSMRRASCLSLCCQISTPFQQFWLSVTPLNFRPLNETKTVKDKRKFGCYIKEKELNLYKI